MTPAEHDGPVGEVPPEGLVVSHEAASEAIEASQYLDQAAKDEVTTILDALARVDAAEARLRAVKASLAGHPVCEKHPDDDVIRCGWKSAVRDARAALSSDAAPQAHDRCASNYAGYDGTGSPLSCNCDAAPRTAGVTRDGHVCEADWTGPCCIPVADAPAAPEAIQAARDARRSGRV